MARLTTPAVSAANASSDADLVRRIRRREEAAFEALMRRHNGKLFRVARAILKDDAEAEDALQDAYLEAYRRIGDFRGDSQLTTWLTRIVINQALMRLRRQKRDRVVVPFGGERPHGTRPAVERRGRRDSPSRRPTRRCAPRCGASSSAGSMSCRWPSGRCSSCARSRT